MILILLSAALFSVGLYGVLTRRGLVSILASVEVMLGAASVLFVGLATRTQSAEVVAEAGTAEAIGVLLVVTFAAEAAVGLALVVAAARSTGTTAADELTEGRGEWRRLPRTGGASSHCPAHSQPSVACSASKPSRWCPGSR